MAIILPANVLSLFFKFHTTDGSLLIQIDKKNRSTTEWEKINDDRLDIRRPYRLLRIISPTIVWAETDKYYITIYKHKLRPIEYNCAVFPKQLIKDYIEKRTRPNISVFSLWHMNSGRSIYEAYEKTIKGCR